MTQRWARHPPYLLFITDQVDLGHMQDSCHPGTLGGMGGTSRFPRTRRVLQALWSELPRAPGMSLLLTNLIPPANDIEGAPCSGRGD